MSTVSDVEKSTDRRTDGRTDGHSYTEDEA